MTVATQSAPNGTPETCDLLIVNGYVLTMDGKRTVYPDGAIAVSGKKIVAVGPRRAVEAAWQATRKIDAQGGTIHPGFIDGHYHAGLHLSRGSITDNPNPPKEEGGGGPGVFTRWINAVTDEDEYASALMASAELVRNGFTGFVDAATSFAPDLVAEAAEAVGIRCSVTDCMLWDNIGDGEPMAAEIPRAPCNLDRSLKEMGGQLKRNRDEDALARGHVAIYGCGSQSDELMREAKNLADREGTVIHQHQSLMVSDAGYDAKRFGKPALVHFAEKGLIGPNSVFTHMNILTPEEVEAVSASGMALVWHPGNFSTTRSRRPARAPSRACTSAARRSASERTSPKPGPSATSASSPIWSAANGANTCRRKPSSKCSRWAAPGRWASRARSAASRSVSAPTSSSAPTICPTPSRIVDVVKQLILVSRTKAVDTVLCNGEIIVRHGQLVRLDEAEIYRLARQSAERTAERAGIKPKSNWPLVT